VRLHGTQTYQNTVRGAVVSHVDIGVQLGRDANANQLTDNMMLGIGRYAYHLLNCSESTITGGFVAAGGDSCRGRRGYSDAAQRVSFTRVISIFLCGKSFTRVISHTECAERRPPPAASTGDNTTVIKAEGVYHLLAHGIQSEPGARPATGGAAIGTLPVIFLSGNSRMEYNEGRLNLNGSAHRAWLGALAGLRLRFELPRQR
jgi:hypothetical protein